VGSFWGFGAQGFAGLNHRHKNWFCEVAPRSAGLSVCAPSPAQEFCLSDLAPAQEAAFPCHPFTPFRYHTVTLMHSFFWGGGVSVFRVSPCAKNRVVDLPGSCKDGSRHGIDRSRIRRCPSLAVPLTTATSSRGVLLQGECKGRKPTGYTCPFWHAEQDTWSLLGSQE
jgi:hypothetical protein